MAEEKKAEEGQQAEKKADQEEPTMQAPKLWRLRLHTFDTSSESLLKKKADNSLMLPANNDIECSNFLLKRSFVFNIQPIGSAEIPRTDARRAR